MQISDQLYRDIVQFFDTFYEKDFSQVEKSVEAMKAKLERAGRVNQPVRPVCGMGG